jgi:hypothetical protein
MIYLSVLGEDVTVLGEQCCDEVVAARFEAVEAFDGTGATLFYF